MNTVPDHVAAPSKSGVTLTQPAPRRGSDLGQGLSVPMRATVTVTSIMAARPPANEPLDESAAQGLQVKM